MNVEPGLEVSPPVFLEANPGNFVVIEDNSSIEVNHEPTWWIGFIIHIIKGARDSQQSSLFQIANIDSGEIKTVNADQIIKIIAQENI